MFALSLIGVGCWWSVAAVISGIDGDALRSVFLFSAAAALFAMSSLFFVNDLTYRRARVEQARITVGPEGICIFPATRQRTVQTAFLLTFTVAGLIFSIGTWTRTLDIPISPGFAVFYPPFMLSGVVLVLTMTARTWLRGTSLGLLRIGPQTVHYEAGLADGELSWDQCTGMSINSPRIGRSSVAACVIYLHSTDAAKPMAITTNMLSTGCAPTYWLLKYYFEHPEHRDELADQRAVDRLMSGRVVTRR